MADQDRPPRHHLLLLTGDALTRAMNGIGMLFEGPNGWIADWTADFEETVFAASVEGMGRGDGRVLGVLTT